MCTSPAIETICTSRNVCRFSRRFCTCIKCVRKSAAQIHRDAFSVRKDTLLRFLTEQKSHLSPRLFRISWRTLYEFFNLELRHRILADFCKSSRTSFTSRPRSSRPRPRVSLVPLCFVNPHRPHAHLNQHRHLTTTTKSTFMNGGPWQFWPPVKAYGPCALLWRFDLVRTAFCFQFSRYDNQ